MTGFVFDILLLANQVRTQTSVPDLTVLTMVTMVTTLTTLTTLTMLTMLTMKHELRGGTL